MLALLAILFTATAWEVSYEGHQVARCLLENKNQGDWLLDLQENADLDIWSIGSDYADVHLVPNDQISEEIRSKLQCKVFIPDLEEHFQSVPARKEGDPPLGGFYDQYPTYAEIVQKLQDLGAQYPRLIRNYTSLSNGKTVQGRDLPYVVVTGNQTTNPKWNFYIQSGLHAREWIGPVQTIYLIEQLAARYGIDANVTRIMNAITFHIAPEQNGDGYVYTWTTDRNWRKNRQNNGNSYGVDLNRNYDDHWGGPGSSGVPTSDTYRGPSPASEPETKAIVAYVRSLANKIGGIDYHSYGPLVLRSWGWTSTPSSDESWLKPIGDRWAYTINQVNRQNYVSEKAAELYVASGCEDDWVSVQNTLGHGWTIELRGNSFVLPPAQILPTGQENFAGLVNMTQELLNRFGENPRTEQNSHDDWRQHVPKNYRNYEPQGP